MATKFYLAEIPDDFPAINVKFENMTKPLLAIPAKMVDGKPITIVGYIDAGQKKYKANDYGFVEFNDNGADFAQFKDANARREFYVRIDGPYETQAYPVQGKSWSVCVPHCLPPRMAGTGMLSRLQEFHRCIAPSCCNERPGCESFESPEIPEL